MLQGCTVKDATVLLQRPSRVVSYVAREHSVEIASVTLSKELYTVLQLQKNYSNRCNSASAVIVKGVQVALHGYTALKSQVSLCRRDYIQKYHYKNKTLQ